MALHLAANGCYGVMIYNNKDYPDSFIHEKLKPHGKVHELQKGGKNLIFVYFKHYEEARSCLDALSSDPEFNAKPAKPRETNRSDIPFGARVRAKSVMERGEKGRHLYDRKKNYDKTEGCSRDGNTHSLRERSMSISSISLEKVDNVKTEILETKSESPEEPKASNAETSSTEKSIQKPLLRPRSKSIGRINIEKETKRAELIKKVIRCENDKSGSLNSLFEKEINSVNNNSNKEESNEEKPFPLHRSMSFYGRLPYENDNRSQNYFYRQKNLWLSPKPKFYKPRSGNNCISQSEDNEPYLLPAMTIYENYVIARQRRKYSHPVVLSGLPLYITEEYLCDLCAKFARVLRIRLVETHRIEECRAYVYVKSKSDAMNLKKNIDRRILFCHIVHVTILSDINNLPFGRY